MIITLRFNIIKIVNLRNVKLNMKIYGYCRISTPHQSIDRQIRNIESAFPDAIVIREVYTGTSQDRPEWNKLLKVLKPKSTIVFDSVSRMSRNAKEGFEEYQELYNRDINLVFLKEPHINTDTYKSTLKRQVSLTGSNVDLILEGVNKYLMALAKEQIRLAFEQSEKEVTDLHQRTKEGMETARRNGKQIGQRKGNKLLIKKEEPVKSIIREKSKDFDGHNTDVEVMAILAASTIKIEDDRHNIREVPAKVSRNTYYKYKSELRA